MTGRWTLIERVMPIRFLPMTTNRGMLPLVVIQPVIGRRLHRPTNAKQRAEGVERIETAIEPERELVEVGLKVLRRDAVMNSLKPALQDPVPRREGRNRLPFAC